MDIIQEIEQKTEYATSEFVNKLSGDVDCAKELQAVSSRAASQLNNDLVEIDLNELLKLVDYFTGFLVKKMIFLTCNNLVLSQARSH